MKKVIGAILVSLVLFSFAGPGWAKNNYFKLKADVDNTVLVSWYMYSLAYGSRDAEKISYAAAFLDQAMQLAASLEETGGYLTDSDYKYFSKGRLYIDCSVTYLYTGKLSKMFKYYMKTQAQFSWLPKPAATNRMYVLLLKLRPFMYNPFASHDDSGGDDSGSQTQTPVSPVTP